MALEVKQLRLAYGSRLLTEHLSFRLEAPFFLAVVGRNGSGKSTLLKALTGSVPYEGNILAEGQDILFLKEKEKAGLFSLIHQKNDSAFDISVKDLLLMGCYRFKSFFESYTSEDEDRCHAILKAVGGEAHWKRKYHELSGGEQQLVWITQSLIQQARYMLMDEPAQFLDVYYRRKIYDLIFSLPEQFGCGVICVTHDLSELEKAKGKLLDFSLSNMSLEELSPSRVNEARVRMETGIQMNL